MIIRPFLATMIGAQKFEEVNDYAVQLFGARDRNELLGTSPWILVEESRRFTSCPWKAGGVVREVSTRSRQNS